MHEQIVYIYSLHQFHFLFCLVRSFSELYWELAFYLIRN